MGTASRPQRGIGKHLSCYTRVCVDTALALPMNRASPVIKVPQMQNNSTQSAFTASW